MKISKSKTNSNQLKNVTRIYSPIQKMSIDNAHQSIKDGIPFVMTPNFVFEMDLTPHEIILWSFLRSLHPEDNPKSYEISEKLKIYKAAIRKCEQSLIDKNMLVKEYVSFVDNPKSNAMISIVYHFPHCYHWKHEVTKAFYEKNPDKIPDEKYYFQRPSIKLIEDMKESVKNKTESGNPLPESGNPLPESGNPLPESGNPLPDSKLETPENIGHNSVTNRVKKEHKKEHKKESKMAGCMKEEKIPASQPILNKIILVSKAQELDKYFYQGKRELGFLDYKEFNSAVSILIEKHGNGSVDAFLSYLRENRPRDLEKGILFNKKNWNILMAGFEEYLCQLETA